MSINQIITPLDSAVLETKEQYKMYFKLIKHAFNEFNESITKNNICSDQEADYLKQYCELLLYSLEAFRIKYLFDEEEKMRIDLSESGFPNYLEFRYLNNDLALKHEHISNLPEISTLKSEFLETLLKQKEAISDYKLNQAASIVYYTSVHKKFVYKRFVQGRIQKAQPNQNAQYVISWSFYDITFNRPFICFMYFDLYKEKIENYTHKIYEVLETVADRNIDLDMMAYAIDKKLSKVLPKKIKRIDLGPLHNVFAKDELKVTHSILEAIVNKTLDISAYALTVAIDEINSSGNFSEGIFISKQQLQVWKAQRTQKYLFSSHRVMQVLYDKIPETLNLLTQDPIEIPALKL